MKKEPLSTGLPNQNSYHPYHYSYPKHAKRYRRIEYLKSAIEKFHRRSNLLSSNANLHSRTENLLSHHSKFSILFIFFPIIDRKFAIRNRKLKVAHSKLLLTYSKLEFKYKNNDMMKLILKVRERKREFSKPYAELLQ